MNFKIKDVLILLIAIIGVITTVKLSIIYYDVNFNPIALPSFCSINNVVDCDGVAKTKFSQFFGIPLSLWGMLFYLFVILMLFNDKLKQYRFLSLLNAFKNPKDYIASLGYLSFIISMGLACESAFVIKKICVLCIATYIMNLLIALLASDWKKSVLESVKISVNDLREDLKEKKYLVSFCIALFLAACLLIYTNFSYVLTPQVKRLNDFNKYKKYTQNNPFKIYGNDLGDKNADLVVYIYTDYRCPICQTYNVILSRAAVELKKVKFVHKNFPLDATCNRTVKSSFHENSCMLARYSIAAEKQERLWDLNTEMFEVQPKTEEDVLELAKKMGFDTVKLKSDANSAETEQKLQEDIEDGIRINMVGTPSIVINGKIYSGIIPYYELKELLIKSGAVEK